MLTNLTLRMQKPVFFDHDGLIDDFIALVALLTIDTYRLTGISITNGKCDLNIAADATLKILDLFCRKDVLVSKSNLKINCEYLAVLKDKCNAIGNLKALDNFKINDTKISDSDSIDFTANCILSQEGKTTVVLTGPATNLYAAIEKYPELVQRIEKVLWMAGAFLADGNVVAPDHDGSAEWNVFCDPASAIGLLKSGVQVVLFPLDACYQVTVDNLLLFNLEQNSESKLCQLCFELLTNSDFRKQKRYFYDILPVMFLKYPEIFYLENTSINIEQRGTSVGNIFRSSLGAKIKYVKKIDDEMFGEYFLEQMSQF